jgi:hypothetical protein
MSRRDLIRLSTALCVLPWLAHAQGYTQAPAVINVGSYGTGLACNGSTDDSATINLATAAFRTAVNAGQSAVLVFPMAGTTGVCATANPVNFSGFRGTSGLIEGNNVTISCRQSGGVCIDASGSAHTSFRDFRLVGVSSAIGWQAARVSSTVDCVENDLTNIVTTGSFSTTAFYNEDCELMSGLRDHFENDATGSTYAAIFDGNNHFTAASTFQTMTVSTDTQQSFKQGDWRELVLDDTSSSGRCLWLGHAQGDNFTNLYCLQGNSTLQPVTLYDESLGANSDLSFLPAHFETGPTDIFLVTGTNAAPVLANIHYHDPYLQATNSVFKIDSSSSVASPQLLNLDLSITANLYSSVKVFDNATPWTGTGSVYVPNSGLWNGPASWGGCVTNASLGTCLPTIGTGLAYTPSTNTLSAPTATTINPAAVAANGGITSFNITNNGGFYLAGGGSSFPSVTIPAPSSGTQATAAIQYVAYEGATLDTGGAGCSVNDILTLAGGSFQTAGQIKVTAVSSGVVTAFTGYSAGSDYISVPSEPVTVTGGTCTTAPTLDSVIYKITGIQATAPGSGYSANQTLSFASMHFTPAATGIVNSSLALSGGTASITLTGSSASIAAHLASTSTYLTSSALSGCGTSPSISSYATDTKGTITEGTTSTGCTLTFGTAYSTTPDCTVTSPGGSALTSYTASTTTLVLVNASSSNEKFAYNCVQ